jgi:hypothetical protein
MQPSLRNSSLLVVLMLLAAEPALASTFERAIAQCRDRIGRPGVQACMEARGKGAELEACRLEASPNVRACVRDAMSGAHGRAGLAGAIARCRDTVGRPIVQACMRAQGHGGAFERCRMRIAPRVRACVRSTMIAVYGHANFRRAIQHCRLSVGRPIVRACMGGRRFDRRDWSRGDELAACRAKASPSVRACVRRKLRAT